MSVYVDTSAFFALLITEDENHSAAGAAWRNLVQSDEQLVTSNYVILETIALLQRRSSKDIIRVFVESILPIVAVEWIEDSLHSAGVSGMLSSGRRGPSLVDCVSFAVMRKLSIKDVFTFDHHFHEQGFRLRDMV